MSRKPRIYYTETDKALMWDRWRKAELGPVGLLKVAVDPLQLLASDPHDLLHSTDMVLNEARLAVKHLYLFTIQSGCALNNSHLLL